MVDLRRPPTVWRALVVLVAAVGSGALAASAQAASPAQWPASAIAQYVEMIPTGDSSQAAAVGAARTTKLPPTISRLIREHGGVDAATLEKVATSSTYGAPAVSAPGPVVRPAAVRPKAPSIAAAPIAPEDRPVPPASLAHALAVAAAEPVSGGFASVWLGLVVVTAAAAFVVARRARGSPELRERAGRPENR